MCALPPKLHYRNLYSKLFHLNTHVIYLLFLQDNGTIMDGDTDGDGAINLSTSQRPSAANTPNGSIDFEDSGQVRKTTYFTYTMHA